MSRWTRPMTVYAGSGPSKCVERVELKRVKRRILRQGTRLAQGCGAPWLPSESDTRERGNLESGNSVRRFRHLKITAVGNGI